MFALYQLYKKSKDKKVAATQESPRYERKLTDDSSITTLDNIQSRSAIAMPQEAAPTQDMPTATQNLREKKEVRKQWIVLAITLFVDIALPIILYYVLKIYLSTLASLLISSAPPIVMVIGKFIIYRQFDPLGLVMIFGFVLSAALSVIDANPRILMLKDSIVSSATGLIFLCSLIPISIGKYQLRPITYGISAEMMSASPKIHYIKNGEAIEQTPTQFSWEHIQGFRNGMRLLTAMWGTVLMLEFIARLIMYFSTLTIDQLVLYSNVVLGCLLGLMGAFTLVYSQFLRRRTAKAARELLARFEAEAAHSSSPDFTNMA